MSIRLSSLGRDLPLGTATEVLSFAAGCIASLNPDVAADELLALMTSPNGYHADLRGKLLLMEIACADLGAPHAFYLLGAVAEVPWRGAPVRLFLFGLYRPEALRSYAAASAELYREKLTGENIHSWMDGRSWPE